MKLCGLPDTLLLGVHWSTSLSHIITLITITIVIITVIIIIIIITIVAIIISTDSSEDIPKQDDSDSDSQPSGQVQQRAPQCSETRDSSARNSEDGDSDDRDAEADSSNSEDNKNLTQLANVLATPQYTSCVGSAGGQSNANGCRFALHIYPSSVPASSSARCCPYAW